MISLKKWMTKVSEALVNIREALDITAVDYTATTGTEQYAGWYYANITLNKANPSAISVVSVTNNRPAFVQLGTSSLARVYCNQANVTVTIRCLYIPAGGVIRELVHKIELVCASLRKGVSVC